jgi:hypothetical protein
MDKRPLLSDRVGGVKKAVCARGQDPAELHGGFEVFDLAAQPRRPAAVRRLGDPRRGRGATERVVVRAGSAGRGSSRVAHFGGFAVGGGTATVVGALLGRARGVGCG